ncbi:class I SAM-dependent methyltransferase [Nocardia brasiliensis]|uniref:class I SAM-dependent methyltransferase n=1 Tax=Nocardia brasiliensis TaxID=37326 RepID=UPI003D946EA8
MSQFDSLGTQYAASVAEMPLREYVEMPSIRRAVGDVTGKTVLDIGCGSGHYARQLTMWGAADVVGIDSSPGMLEQARATPTQGFAKPTYLQRDVATPPPDGDAELDGRFDVVISVYTACYMPTRDGLAGFLTTARRALGSADGKLVVATLNPDYDRTDSYYAPYDFTLTSASDEGASITLDARLPSGRIAVSGYFWSRRTYEEAATAAGFRPLTWHEFTVTDEGASKYGREYWSAYARAPHGIVFETGPH